MSWRSWGQSCCRQSQVVFCFRRSPLSTHTLLLTPFSLDHKLCSPSLHHSSATTALSTMWEIRFPDLCKWSHHESSRRSKLERWLSQIPRPFYSTIDLQWTHACIHFFLSWTCFLASDRVARLRLIIADIYWRHKGDGSSLPCKLQTSILGYRKAHAIRMLNLFILPWHRMTGFEPWKDLCNSVDVPSPKPNAEDYGTGVRELNFWICVWHQVLK